MQNEVDWLVKIQHQNIVSLLGYCIHGKTRLLVYEIMQNGSLESQLHGINSFLDSEVIKNIVKVSERC